MCLARGEVQLHVLWLGNVGIELDDGDIVRLSHGKAGHLAGDGDRRAATMLVDDLAFPGTAGQQHLFDAVERFRILSFQEIIDHPADRLVAAPAVKRCRAHGPVGDAAAEIVDDERSLVEDPRDLVEAFGRNDRRLPAHRHRPRASHAAAGASAGPDRPPGDIAWPFRFFRALGITRQPLNDIEPHQRNAMPARLAHHTATGKRRHGA
jgi:hypothetical protein